VRSAVSRFTRERVFPLEAIAGPGRYICECCDAPVHLVRGYPYYFAHEKYQASPDCENYVWSEYRYSGRPSRPGTASELDPEEVSYLAFEMSLDGPRLVVFLPAVTLSGYGFIELISRTSRQVPVSHLARGLRLSFPLSESTWTLRASDDVNEDYISRLTLGRQSLELDRNLFSASSETGRRIGPRATIMLGESLWWVGRTDIRTAAPVPRNVDLQCASVDHGWYVFQVTLPDTATENETALLAQWLQRRIQPRRARVWIESPFPRARHPDGVSVFAIADGVVHLRADRPVAIEVFDSSGIPLLVVENVSEAHLPAVRRGELVVRADGVRVGQYRFVADVPHTAASAIVDLADRATIDFIELQARIDGAAHSGASSLSGRLRWRPSALQERLTKRCKLGTNTAIEADFVIAPGQSIEFDKLGAARWLAPTRSGEQQAVIASLPREDLFHWLASVGRVGMHSPGRLRLHPSQASQNCFPALHRISQLSWPAMLAAQVRTAERVLEGFK
jgi:hypothetical protein